MTARAEDLERIRSALLEAGALLRRFSPERVDVAYKGRGSPVTDADHAADALLRTTLPRPGEGWLSEETPDDRARLGCERVWIVDPLDGTREFLAGTPEWCVSIGLAERGVPVAGGVLNPVRDEMFLGAVETGASLNGQPMAVSPRPALDGALVLVSRWASARRQRLVPGGPAVRSEPMGPLAYRLALIAAGRADATWGPSSSAEWDVAAGAALIAAAGGRITSWDGAPVTLNRWPPRVAGFVAAGPALHAEVRALIAARRLR